MYTVFKAPSVCRLYLTTPRNPRHLPAATVGLTIIKLQPLKRGQLVSVFASFSALQLLSFSLASKGLFLFPLFGHL